MLLMVGVGLVVYIATGVAAGAESLRLITHMLADRFSMLSLYFGTSIKNT